MAFSQMEKPLYSRQKVRAHGSASAIVVLMNEAPGPDEDRSRIPCFGQQGGVIYRMFRRAEIAWSMAEPSFKWPILDANGKSIAYEARLKSKARFLNLRKLNLLVTNAFPRWPKPSNGKAHFCPPRDKEVISPANIQRIVDELNKDQRVLLLCGAKAYLACVGQPLLSPSSRENDRLTFEELCEINERLKTNFKAGWYMGHTRRWSMHGSETVRVLREVAQLVGWMLVEENVSYPFDQLSEV